MNRFVLIIFVTALSLWLTPAAWAQNQADLTSHPVYSSYNFGKETRIINLGILPMAAPIGVIAETLRHDRILAAALRERGWEVRGHCFLKGQDIAFFFHRGDIDLTLVSEWLAIEMATSRDIMVVALAKKGFSSIITKNIARTEDLKGKRVATVPKATAHYGLLVALDSAGLKETDIIFTPLEFSQLAGALAGDKVDAIAAWDPAAANALATHPEFKVLQRVINCSYFCLSKTLVKEYPEIADLLIASYIRGLRWMRTDDSNLRRAVGWNLKAGEDLLGGPSGLSFEEVARTTAGDLLQIAASPAVPRQDLEEKGYVHRAFTLLKDQGKIPADRAEEVSRAPGKAQERPTDASWERVIGSFDRTLVEKILAAPTQYRILEYDYDDE